MSGVVIRAKVLGLFVFSDRVDEEIVFVRVGLTARGMDL